MDTRPKTDSISLVVITCNNGHCLEQCLNSTKELVDEIVVVDMQSTDNSLLVANSFGARVFSHQRLPYVEPARNYAIARALHPWVLVLDPDEVFVCADSQLLARLLTNSDGISAYSIRRRNKVFDKWMVGCGLGEESDKQIRLFRKDKVS